MARPLRRRLLALGPVGLLALTFVGAQAAVARQQLAGSGQPEHRSGREPGNQVSTEAATQAAIHATISRQLVAFQRDDAEAAFAIAAPFIQQKFRSPEIFMAMVRRGYPVIYQPASVEFLDLNRLTDGTHLQLVQMSDADGKIWIMEYLLSLDEQGNWRINGVQQQRTGSNLI